MKDDQADLPYEQSAEQQTNLPPEQPAMPPINWPVDRLINQPTASWSTREPTVSPVNVADATPRSGSLLFCLCVLKLLVLSICVLFYPHVLPALIFRQSATTVYHTTCQSLLTHAAVYLSYVLACHVRLASGPVCALHIIIWPAPCLNAHRIHLTRSYPGAQLIQDGCTENTGL